MQRLTAEHGWEAALKTERVLREDWTCILLYCVCVCLCVCVSVRWVSVGWVSGCTRLVLQAASAEQAGSVRHHRELETLFSVCADFGFQVQLRQHLETTEVGGAKGGAV